MGSVLVPKGPRVEHQSEAEQVAEMRRLLFSLPLPPVPPGRDGIAKGRAHNTTTALGRMIRLKRMTLDEVSRLPIDGIPSQRTLSKVLAGTRELSPSEAQALARGLGCDWRVL